jgi:uncharacterized RDD family membrane protein YckC
MREAHAPAGLFRRLAALFYDILLTIALAFAVSFAFLLLTDGEAILASTQGLVGHLYHAVLLLLVLSYYCLSWMRRGQTLGMRAWRIRLQQVDGGRVPWSAALIRFAVGLALAMMAVAGSWRLLTTPGWPIADLGAAMLVAPLAANYAWMAIGRQSRTLQDMAGGLRVVRS